MLRLLFADLFARSAPTRIVIGLAVLTAAAPLHARQDDADHASAMNPVALELPPEVVEEIPEVASPPIAEMETAPRATVEQTPLGAAAGLFSIGPDQERGGDDGGAGLLAGRAGEWVRVIGALVVVLGLLLTLRVAIRRLGRPHPRPSGLIEVLARYPLGRGHQLVVLKWARRVVLVHQNGSSMTTLSEMNDSDEVAALLARVEAGSRRRPTEAFRGLLRRYESDHEQVERVAATPRSRGNGEIVDLTRGSGNGLGRLLASRRVAT